MVAPLLHLISPECCLWRRCSPRTYTAAKPKGGVCRPKANANDLERYLRTGGGMSNWWYSVLVGIPMLEYAGEVRQELLRYEQGCRRSGCRAKSSPLFYLFRRRITELYDQAS